MCQLDLAGGFRSYVLELHKWGQTTTFELRFDGLPQGYCAVLSNQGFTGLDFSSATSTRSFEFSISCANPNI